MKDVRDGSYYQTEYFPGHPGSLMIRLYRDDFEIVNPIGSHWKKKHKLSVLYWTLLNIHPAFGFKIQEIQLLDVAKSVDCKMYGLSKISEDIVESIKELFTGKRLQLDQNKKIYCGILYCVLRDTQAAQLLAKSRKCQGVFEVKSRVR